MTKFVELFDTRFEPFLKSFQDDLEQDSTTFSNVEPYAHMYGITNDLLTLYNDVIRGKDFSVQAPQFLADLQKLRASKTNLNDFTHLEVVEMTKYLHQRETDFYLLVMEYSQIISDVRKEVGIDKYFDTTAEHPADCDCGNHHHH